MPPENPFAFRKVDPAAPLGVRLDQATDVLGFAGAEGFNKSGVHRSLFGGIDPDQAAASGRLLLIDEVDRLAAQGVAPAEMLPMLSQTQTFKTLMGTPGFKAQDIISTAADLVKMKANPVGALRSDFQTLALNPFAANVDKATDAIGFEGRTPDVANSELGAPTGDPAIEAAGNQLSEARKVLQWAQEIVPNITTDKGFSGFLQKFNVDAKRFGQPTFGEQKPVTPETALGKLRRDLDNGLIGRDDFVSQRNEILRSDEPLTEVQDPKNPGRTIFMPRSKAAGMAGPASREGTRAQKVASLVEQGLSEADAANVVDGHVRFEIVPQTGNARLIDQIKGTVREVPISGASTASKAAAAPKAGGRVPILSDVSRYGGTAPIGETVQKYTFGLVGDNTERNAQRQRYRLLRETVIDAFQRSGRPSNYAQQRVEELLPSTGVFESPGGAHDQLATMYEVLQANMEDDQQIADDPNMPQGERAEAKGRILKARRALEMIGDPAKFPRTGSLPDGVPPGSTQIGVTDPGGKPIYHTPDGEDLVVE